MVGDHAFAHGLEIPLEVHKLLVKLDKTSKNEIYVHEVKPNHRPVQVVGQVIQVNRDANFFKRFNIVDNAVGKDLLGKLNKKTYAEVVVREEPDEETRFSLEYTFFALQDQLDQRGVLKSMFVLTDIEPYELLGRTKIWLAVNIHRGKGGRWTDHSR